MKRFSGHIGSELFEGTIEEWACRVGGTVTGPSTISIDLNRPTPFGKPLTLETRFGREGRPDLYTVTAGHRAVKSVCAGALRHRMTGAPRVGLLASAETPALNAALRDVFPRERTEETEE